MAELGDSTTTDAKPIAAANGLGGTSPFRRQEQQNDPLRKGIVIGLAAVLFVFLVSMIAVLFMHAPSL